MLKLPSLHTNTEYSFQESTIRIDALINMAKREGLSALVITDHNNMYGVFEFVEKCRREKIKPIIGLDLDVEDFRLVLLARNYEGYTELARLSSLKMRAGIIKRSDIAYNNLYVIDHPTRGFYRKHQEMLVPENFFVPTTRNLPNAIDVHETRILDASENVALSILEAQQSGSNTVIDKHYLPYKFIYDSTDYRALQIAEIIKDCNVIFPKKVNYLPKFRNPSGKTSPEYLRLLTMQGLEHFLSEHPSVKTEVYRERVNHELEIIERLGYEDYFLIIHDFINWAKKKGIAIGPGRGSAAGSLVTFLLNITEVDPLEFGLLFERFLNPERVSLPDIDIDIQDTRRMEVVNYIFTKYGYENVAQISTFATLGAKSAFRDVARVYNIPVRDVNGITKLIPDDLSLREAFTKNAKFRALINSSEEYLKVYSGAILLEGLPRQAGTHAAGVIISAIPIERNFPVTVGGDALNQIQLSMNYLEQNGLLKIDLLGLKGLTILQNIQKQLLRTYERKLDLQKIPLDDKITNHLLSEADTNGVFQLESFGMKSTLLKVGVTSFNDIVAIISLYRPGPMDNINLYADRKNKVSPVPKVDPIIDDITRDTYGIIIYQEQIMQIAQRYCGFSFGEADILRRAIGKKNAEQIEQFKSRFLERALHSGHTLVDAERVFTIIEKFADYGFNKSHAVAYGMMAYRMAYVKARFKFEFYAALIESSLGSQDSVRKYVNEARANQVAIVPPEINFFQSSVFTSNKQIYLPLSIIKGIGQAVEDKILAERANGLFTDFFDAVTRLRLAGVSETTITTLIEANVLRAFGNVQTLLDALPSAVRYSELAIVTREGVKTIDRSLAALKPPLNEQPRNLADEINYEMAAYGFLLNAFPTANFETAFKIGSLKNNVAQEVVAYYGGAKTFRDKANRLYAVATLIDSTAEIGLTIFEGEWAKVESTKVGSIISAKILVKDYNGRLSYNLVVPWKVIKSD